MKPLLLKFIVAIVVVCSSSFSAYSQFVIKVRPEIRTVKVRPVSPGPRHVWVSSEYVWKGNQYEYTDGYWAVPPARRHHWVEGRWKARRGGWVWIPGHWR